MKLCRVCGKEKSLAEFSKRKDSDDGYRNTCKECIREYYKIYRVDNKISLNAHKKYLRNKSPHLTRAKSSYYSHKQRGMILQLTISDIEEKFLSTKYCPICGKEMIIEYGNGHNRLSPSLDRINNDSILTKDNTWIICNRCNTMKADLSMYEYVEYCKLVHEKFRRN